MNNFEEIINKTQDVNKAVSDYSRIIVETDEKNPKVIAVITNHDFETADGYTIRLKPIYEDAEKDKEQEKLNAEIIAYRIEAEIKKTLQKLAEQYEK